MDFFTGKVDIKADIPTTHNRLNILEPITFPSAIPFWP